MSTSNPTSAVGLVNNALVRLGQSPISAFTDEAAEAVAAEQLYNQVVRGALNKNDWAFAFSESQPSALANPVTSLTNDFDYAYPVPGDALRILGLQSRAQYVEAYGKEIWTNDNDPQIFYIRDADVPDFTPEFVDWVVLELAHAFAIAITQDLSRAQFFAGMAQKAWVDAIAIDGQRDTPLRLIYEDILNDGFTSRY